LRALLGLALDSGASTMSHVNKSPEDRDWLIPVLVTTAFAVFFLHTQLVAPWLLRREMAAELRREEIDKKIAGAKSELEYFKNLQSKVREAFEARQEKHKQEEFIKSEALRIEYQQRIAGIEAEIERLKRQR